MQVTAPSPTFRKVRANPLQFSIQARFAVAGKPASLSAHSNETHLTRPSYHWSLDAQESPRHGTPDAVPFRWRSRTYGPDGRVLSATRRSGTHHFRGHLGDFHGCWLSGYTRHLVTRTSGGMEEGDQGRTW